MRATIGLSVLTSKYESRAWHLVGNYRQNSASMNSTKRSLKYPPKKENCICTEYMQIFLSLFPKYNKATIYTTVTLNEVSELN